jgi:nicotinate-nucleotide--dimethylbenzimidazole phosphoribosyltransferase
MDSLVKPRGSLGALEDIAVWLSSCQGEVPPRMPQQPTVVIFAGDHGIARTAATSAYPPEVTAQMVHGFAAGYAAINALASEVGLSIHAIDVSVDCPPIERDGLLEPAEASKVRRSSGSIDTEDAMTHAEYARAWDVGVRAVTTLAKAGTDLLIIGDMGIGNTTAASALIGWLTGASADETTGYGTGIDSATWDRKVAAIERAWTRVRTRYGDDLSPEEVLRTLGGPDLVAMCAGLTQAAHLGLPVILDGTVVTAAALVAARREPGVVPWWLAGHRSTEPAHTRALAALELVPILDLGMRLGEGSGAAVTVALVRCAVACARGMATFDGAGVSDKGVTGDG